MRLLSAFVLAALTVGGAATAVAQQGPSVRVTRRAPLVVQPAPPVQVRPLRPLFYLFGVPVVVDAPVAPPYCNCAYASFGGQLAEASAATGLRAQLGG